jgi:O-antigen ligase
MNSLDRALAQCGYIAVFSLCLFSFTSLALSNIYHVLMLVPGFYFLVRYPGGIAVPKSVWSLVVLWGACSLSTVVNLPMENALDKWGSVRYYLIGVISIWALTAWCALTDRSRSIRWALMALLITASVANINGIIAIYTNHSFLRFGPPVEPSRAAGMFSLSITYANSAQWMVLLAIGVLVSRWRSADRWLMGYAAVAALTSGAGLYFSLTRGAIIGAVLGLPFLFLRANRRIFVCLAVAVAVALTIATIVVFSGGSATNRILMPASGASNTVRISQFQAAFFAFLEKPWVGQGIGNFSAQSTRIKEKHGVGHVDFVSHAHNNFLEFLASAGIFGFLAFCAFQIFWFREMWVRQDFVGDIGMAVVVSFAVSGLVQVTALDAENVFFLLLLYTISQITPTQIARMKRLLSVS